MKTSAFIVSAVAALVNAEAFFTNSEINPVPGEPFTLTWDDATGPVTILLKDGPSEKLETVDTLATDVTGGSFTFILDPADYPSGTYAFEIIDGDAHNYSLQFEFEGTGEADDDDEDTTTASATPSATATETDEETTASPTASATDDEEEPEETSSSSRPSPTADENDSEETDVPGAAGRVSSPLALIMVTIAAMVYFN